MEFEGCKLQSDREQRCTYNIYVQKKSSEENAIIVCKKTTMTKISSSKFNSQISRSFPLCG